MALKKKDTPSLGKTTEGALVQVQRNKGHVICYESWKLKEHERKYATHDLELVVIVHTLRMWRHYLTSNIFELRSTHHSLKYLFEHTNLIAR